MKFTELALKPEVLNALAAMGYEEMTPIQEQAIPHILEGRDVLGMAETGSGKTSACGVPLVHLADPDLNNVQVLVIVPTRELALQYVEEVGKVADQAGVATFAIFGGFDMAIQRTKLRHKVHILVATPGRLIDFLWNTDIIDLRQVRTVVLDEADEMLKMGFIEDVDFIMSCMLQEHQTLLFSATMPAEIERLTKAYLKDPVRIQLNRDQRAPQSIQHHFQHAGADRFDVLLSYPQQETIEQAIIFCNSRDKGGTLYRDLRRKFPSIEFIHGGLEQDRRISIFNRFREKQIRLLVATDVAGRGLDFSHVTHVINFDFPFNLEIYLHRTGRTGRMGRTGTALTLVTDHDLKNFDRLVQGNRIQPVWRGQAPDLGQASTRRARGGRQRPRDGGRGGKRGAGRKTPAS